MNNLARIRVCAPPEAALRKLSRADIPVFSLKKRGAYTAFCVKDNYIKKVFAIFSHPCYNVVVEKYGIFRSLAKRAASRAGALVGAALFFALVAASQLFVFRVEVTGSGSYLAPQVQAILRESGVEAGKIYKGVDKPLTIARIMSLPSVTFCSLQKRGTAFIVDVECDGEAGAAAGRSPLLSPAAGVVESITAVCGTARVQAGESVNAGDVLIEPSRTDAAGNTFSCLAVGYARIRAEAAVTTLALSEGEQALAAALAAGTLYSDEAEVLSYTVRRTAEGALYTVNFTYVLTASINMQ